MKKELRVRAIENGTVIDHIPSDLLFDVINVLKLTQIQNPVTFGCNFDSNKLGKKAIIKIWDHFLEDEDINKLALVAPEVKINHIKDYEVDDKHTVNIPTTVEDIVKCINPKCITNCEKMMTRFDIINQKPIILKCHYCEKIVSQEDIVIK